MLQSLEHRRTPIGTEHVGFRICVGRCGVAPRMCQSVSSVTGVRYKSHEELEVERVAGNREISSAG